MAERLLTRYHRSFLLCNACDYAYRVELDMPPQGSENIILRTGRLLSGAKEERIEQNIAQTDESLQKLGAKVKDLMALVAQLHDGERELMERRKVQQAYLAPVRRLPPGIVSIIFKMYCGDRSVDLLQKRCPPLFLSSVCKVWRDTILGLHSVWNHFEFSTYGIVSGSKSRRLLNRLRAFLEYSGNLPLRHCVTFSLDTFSARDSTRTQPLDLLIEHAHRWTEVEFESGGGLSEGARTLLGKLDGRRLTCLQKLDGDVHVLAACSAMGLFVGLTTLRSVTLRGVPYDLRRTDVPPNLPWDHVEEMTTFLPCEYALAYLQRCPNLVEWSYADTSRSGAGQMYLPRPCITLPRLKTLSVHFSHGSNTGLLHGITTPALQDCALRFISGFNPDANIGLGDFLARSACPLRYLVLEYPPRSVMNALHSDALQGLTSLSVRADRRAPLTKAFINLLSTSDSAGRPRLLPLLENL